MTLDNELRTLLRDKAKEAGTPSAAPSSLFRRGRQRQAMLVVTSALMVAAVVSGSIAGFAAIRGREPVSGSDPGTTRTSVVENVELTYPSTWSLAEINDEVVIGTGKAGPTGSIEGRGLFQLANFTPSEGLTYPAGCPGNEPPPGGVVLYVQTLNYPRVPGFQPASWPVGINERGPSDFNIPCGAPAPPRYATWTAQGRIFEAAIYGSPGSELNRLLQVFGGLRFGDAPKRSPQAPGAGPWWVLDSGVVGAQRWNLLAYASTYPLAPTRVCVGLQVNGWYLKGECNLNMSLDQPGAESVGIEAEVVRVSVGAQIVTYLYGGSSPAGATVTNELTRGTAAAPRLSPMPASLQVRFEAVVVVGGAHVGGDIRSIKTNSPGMGAFPYFSGGHLLVTVDRLPVLQGAP